MPSYTNSTAPWERQKGESEKAYEAFSLYLKLGAERTISAVVKELKKSRSLIDRWKERWDWEERVREYDNDTERKAKKEAEKGLREMYTRQVKVAMTMQAKALKALDMLDVEAMSPKDIKEYIKIATDLERLNRTMSAGKADEAAQNTESIADMITSAYEKRKGGGGV